MKFKTVKKEDEGYTNAANCIKWNTAMLTAPMRKKISKSNNANNRQHKRIDPELHVTKLWLFILC